MVFPFGHNVLALFPAEYGQQKISIGTWREKDRSRVLGQTNKRVLSEGLQRELRRASTAAETLLWTHLRAKRLCGDRV